MQYIIKQVKSDIGYSRRQRETVKGLGLGKMNRVSILKVTPEITGMINKVAFLLEVQKVESADGHASAKKTASASAAKKAANKPSVTKAPTPKAEKSADAELKTEKNEKKAAEKKVAAKKTKE